jgi:signal transduction histidine kinase
MRNIIRDLLDFSHINKATEEFEQVDLNAIVNDVKSDLELLIFQKQAVINTDQLPTIEAIPIQMNQLIYNLLNNAMKFTKEDVQPVINIACRQIPKEELPSGLSNSKNYFEIIIKDNGIGFDPRFAEKIFNMFQRLSKSYSGTGIGLAICKKIADNHKGSIAAHSEPGQGATFTIVLPQKQ